MTADKLQSQVMDASVHKPKFYEGLSERVGDVGLHQRHYIYKTDAGIVSGCDFSVMFTIERSAKEVWPHLRDFNRWQNQYGYYYSGVVGDLYSEEDLRLGRAVFHIAQGKDGPVHPYPYEVLRIIPEHLIISYQPIQKGGMGDVSPGFGVIMLNEHAGSTVITVVMEHAFRTNEKSEEEALAFWRGMAEQIQSMWRDSFIPTLKKLVYEGQTSESGND